ncbi:MAG: polyprenol monophosphomannose synthase [Deltaproteobacteria bacterium]|nr:polyprenol monophosphomannose synthase [Deltaproteobacteria bacterium]
MKNIKRIASQTVICIPTYNEVNNIEPLVLKILNTYKEISILVIDDSSTDGTVETAKKLQDKFERVFLLSRGKKEGLGVAYKAGFKFALENNFNYIIQMDGDFSHNPVYIKNLLSELETSDMVIGSRFVKSGSIGNRNYKRNLLSSFSNIYSQFILRTSIKDLTGGFNAISSDSLRLIDFETIVSRGFMFQIELKYRCFLKALKISEIPIVFEKRRSGHSKMNRQIIAEAFILVLKLKKDPILKFKI